MNNKELIEKLEEIEQKAISKYTDNIGITEMLLETLDDDEIEEYNKLHIEYYGSCFYCGFDFMCSHCNDIKKELGVNNE